MARFYLLPSRAALGRQFNDFLSHAFPGLSWPRADWSDLAEALGNAATAQHDVFVVFREDLPEDMEPLAALTTDFGAEPGDDVIELQAGVTHQWLV